MSSGRSWPKLIVRSVVAISTVVMVIAGTTGAAFASPVHRTVGESNAASSSKTVTIRRVATSVVVTPSIIKVGAHGSVTPQDSFTCPGKSTVVVNATYTLGTLDSTETVYSTFQNCSEAVATEMDATTTLEYDSNPIGNAGYDECNAAVAPYCASVNATNQDSCNEGVLCSGTYQAYGIVDTSLVPGYVWSTPLPSQCSFVNQATQTITCDYYSNPVAIGPFE
jgi:hypothetical protein